jgi:hypothetical protein
MESANLAQYEKTLADQQFLGGYVSPCSDLYIDSSPPLPIAMPTRP